jgi:DNA-binding IclR family transcriptional regulator
MKHDARDASVVKSAGRVLEIFEYFADRQTPATVMEVSRELGYPQSSTSALMKSLLGLGYLSYDRYLRQFNPTLRIAFMGNWIHENLYSDGNVLSLMAGLQHRTEEAVVLGVQNDIHLQYIRVIQAVFPLRLYVRAGMLRPMARSAVGKMLLSAKPDQEIRALLIRINAAEASPENRVKLSDLLADMRRCRKDGYYISNGTAIPGAGVIAMLLPELPGHARMALGIGAPIPRLREKKQKIIDALREAIAPAYAARNTK